MRTQRDLGTGIQDWLGTNKSESCVYNGEGVDSRAEQGNFDDFQSTDDVN
jgi:hypothetical protein